LVYTNATHSGGSTVLLHEGSAPASKRREVIVVQLVVIVRVPQRKAGSASVGVSHHKSPHVLIRVDSNVHSCGLSGLDQTLEESLVLRDIGIPVAEVGGSVLNIKPEAVVLDVVGLDVLGKSVDLISGTSTTSGTREHVDVSVAQDSLSSGDGAWA